MVTSSDIILKLIKESGYTSAYEFAKKNGFEVNSFTINVKKNSWTPQIIEKVGNALGKNLSFLANATVGRKKGFIVRK